MKGFKGVGASDHPAMNLSLGCTRNCLTIVSPLAKGDYEDLLPLIESDSLVPLDNARERCLD